MNQYPAVFENTFKSVQRFFLTGILGTAPIASANSNDLKETRSQFQLAGDILQFFPSTFATTLNFMEEDEEGNKLLLKSVLGGVIITNFLKIAMNDSHLGTRPNGGAWSFPSGHTSFACTGAAFVKNRYARTHGLIAMNIAAFVGYSRIRANKHHARDVIFGCALSFAIDRYFVGEKREEILIYPSVNEEHFGLLMSYNF